MIYLLLVVMMAVLIIGAIWLFDLERRLGAIEGMRRGVVTKDGGGSGDGRTTAYS